MGLALAVTGPWVGSGCRSAPPLGAAHRVVAYVMGSRDVTVQPAAARQLTHVNYAFANVRDDRIVLARPADAQRLDTLRALKQYNPDLKVLLAVGGWAWSDHFSGTAPRNGPSTAQSVQRFLAAGVTACKLVIGAAFYGRWWSSVAPSQRGRYQPHDTAHGALPYDSMAAHYVNRNGFVRHWDDAAQAPYLWHPGRRAFVTYDDLASLQAKAAYVRAQGLGGVMHWKHSHNADGALVQTLHDALR